MEYQESRSRRLSHHTKAIHIDIEEMPTQWVFRIQKNLVDDAGNVNPHIKTHSITGQVRNEKEAKAFCEFAVRIMAEGGR